MTRSRSMISVAWILAPLVLLAGQAPPSSGRRGVPRLEWAGLPSIVEKGPGLETGFLVVPERRFPKPNGRTVRLPFIIIKSRSASPRPDPVLFMAGGPGASTLFQTRLRRRSPLLDDRDLILLEQRGTRFAEPALMCPEIERAGRSGWGTRLNGDPDPAKVAAAMASCAGSLERAGVDLAGYTTRESAADVADLRRLLGLPSWNLYGVSYSTKLMLTVLRDHPRGIRAVILDSVLPLEADWDEDGSANILESLDKIFAVCRDDESLRARFPALKARFLRLLAAANRSPIQLKIKNPADGKPMTLTLDGAGIMNCLYAGLEDASMIPWLPLIIDAACRGEVARLAPLAGAYLGSTQGTAMAMRLAVWCNEEFPFEDPAKMRRPAGLPPELARFVQTAVPLEALQAWPLGHPGARENEPVRSRAPVLIAAGEFDPDTPVKWAREAASFLPNAHLVEFAGYTHVPLFGHPEAARIMKEFLSDPSRRPDPRSASTRPAFRLSWEEAPRQGSPGR
jgi:pimeloyl-ACP methyl ester carboxylesterase